MPDEANDAQASTEEAGAEQTAEESQTETKETSEDSGDTEESKDEGESTEDSQDEKSEDAPSDKGESKEEKPKPKPRRSASYRIQQLVKEKNDLQAKLEKKEQERSDDEGAGGEKRSQDDQPNVEELVNKALDQRLKPVIDSAQKQADDAEIGDLFSAKEKSERQRYEPIIRKMWEEPQYRDISAEDLYKIVTFEDSQQQAAKEAREADEKAKKSSTGGNSTSNRSGKSGKSISEMTPEEFQRHNERLKAKL